LNCKANSSMASVLNLSSKNACADSPGEGLLQVAKAINSRNCAAKDVRSEIMRFLIWNRLVFRHSEQDYYGFLAP